MNKNLFIAAFISMALQSQAMSRLYDYEASAIVENGKPCFYTNRQVGDETPNHLRGRGVHAEVYEARGDAKWDAWFSQRLKITPISPKTCLMYGTASPDQNRQRAIALEFEKPYLFLLSGEYGRYGLYFCLIKSPHGETRVTKSEYKERWICTDKPLAPPKSGSVAI